MTLPCKRKHFKQPPKNLTAIRPLPKSQPVAQQPPTSLPGLYIHNMRSLNLEKFHELNSLPLSNCGLILLTETWLTNQNEHLYAMNGFTMYTSNRTKRVGGGAAIYIRNELSVEVFAKHESKHMSSVWLILHCKNSAPVLYGNIYHPPNTTKQHQESTIDHIVTTISQAIQKYPNAKICVAGDFNDLDTSILTDLLPLTQIVDFPTRGSSKLDLVFTDCSEYIAAGCTKEAPIQRNDHCAISVPCATRLHTPKYTTITKRDITPASKIALSKALENTDWTPIYRESSPDSKAEMLQNTVQALVDRHCPARQVRVPVGKPAVTSKLIRKLRRAKQRAFNRGNPAWKVLSELLKIQMKNELLKMSDNKINNVVKGSKQW